MSKILHVDSSSRSTPSVTRQLSRYVVDALTKIEPTSTVKYIDLMVTPPPFVTEAAIGAVYTPSEMRTPEQRATWKDIETRIDDVLSADVLVFGVPMYNFSVPAVFKAFIDSIVIAGKTFSYDNGQLKPLVLGKKAYILTASGGDYAHAPMDKMDFLEPYLRTIFGFMGITDVTFFKAPGHSPEEIDLATIEAKNKIDEAICGKTPAGAIS